MQKKSKYLLLFLFLGIINSHASLAQTIKNIFDAETPVVYLGIDFTQAKIIGEQTEAGDIRNKEFPAINNTVITQPNKYDIATALRRTSIANDLSLVAARNRQIAVQQIKSDNSGEYTHLKISDIGIIVNSYDLKGKTGIGLVIIVDGMSKVEKAATMYVTFINMATKRVLLTDRIEGKGGGFGFRNYWLKAIEDVVKKIERSKYTEWKKNFEGWSGS